MIKLQVGQKELKAAIKNGLKLLFWDTETSLMEVYTHYIGQKVSISPGQIKVPSKVICIQYMFEGESKAKYLEWDRDSDGFNDSLMLQEFVENVLNQADIIVGQNSDNFDHKVLNFRLMLQGLPSMDDKPSIDILKLSRKAFRGPSHKLDFRSTAYGFGGKNKMEMIDWIDLSEGKTEVADKMGPYGCKDVTDTRKVFWKELPYYPRLPLKVEKVIEKFLPEIAQFCQKCADRRQRRFDVIVTKISAKRDKVECLNCNTSWIIEV